MTDIPPPARRVPRSSSDPAVDTRREDGTVVIPGDHDLEGILEWPDRSPAGDTGALPVLGGVVLAHPHSLHGGTMANPVVYRTAQACRQERMATLRFNFRGVGVSGGRFSGTDEARDVEAAVAFLADRLCGGGDGSPGGEGLRGGLPLVLAGYSFGSIMAARAGAGPIPVSALVLIAFPVDWDEAPPDTYARLAGFDGPVLAVCAKDDELSSPASVERTLTRLRLDFRLEVVDEADHFFEGRQREVAARVAAFVREVAAGGPSAHE